MRFGVVGRGKTGQEVIHVLGEKVTRVFSSEQPIEMNLLTDLDTLIVFVTADVLKSILPKLIESGCLVVCGTTGFAWPSDFSEELKKKHLTWIVGSNFSPGMNFMLAVASLVQKNIEFLGKPELSIHDLHHVHKKDAPSGTALKIQGALGGSTPIFSERMGDHPGLHELTVSSALESLSFKHEAKSRKAFAEGAVYAAEKLLPTLKPGLHHFEAIMKDKILKP